MVKKSEVKQIVIIASLTILVLAIIYIPIIISENNLIKAKDKGCEKLGYFEYRILDSNENNVGYCYNSTSNSYLKVEFTNIGGLFFYDDVEAIPIVIVNEVITNDN